MAGFVVDLFQFCDSMILNSFFLPCVHFNEIALELSRIDVNAIYVCLYTMLTSVNVASDSTGKYSLMTDLVDSNYSHSKNSWE